MVTERLAVTPPLARGGAHEIYDRYRRCVGAVSGNRNEAGLLPSFAKCVDGRSAVYPASVARASPP